MKYTAIFASLLLIASFAFAQGYDEWGYNYNANIFNGYYCDSYHDAAWCQPYKDINLQMKWNDAWLNENKDRHEGYDSYIGSGAWLTNHQAGGKGKDKWTYFVKIKALDYEGQECAQPIWGSFCVVQEVESGSGLSYKDLDFGVGFGN